MMNTVLHKTSLSNGVVLELVQGDITAELVDAIVNAANSHLQHGGGVAWVISSRGGETINRESAEWICEHGKVSHAEPAYTSGGNLPCKYVIHAVGPVWGEGDEDAKLAAAVQGSLKRAEELKLSSISFPAISTGIFGFPKTRAASIMFSSIEEYFAKQSASGIRQVRITLYDQQTLDAFTKIWIERGWQ